MADPVQPSPDIVALADAIDHANVISMHHWDAQQGWMNETELTDAEQTALSSALRARSSAGIEHDLDPGTVARNLRGLEARMQYRAEAIEQRDGKGKGAIEGQGIGIGYLLVKDIVGALGEAATLVEAARTLDREFYEKASREYLVEQAVGLSAALEESRQEVAKLMRDLAQPSAGAARAPYAVEYRIERDGHLYSYMHAGNPPDGAQDVRWLYLDAAQPSSEASNELRAAAERARGLLRRLLEGKKLGVEYAAANDICHQITAALAISSTDRGPTATK